MKKLAIIVLILAAIVSLIYFREEKKDSDSNNSVKEAVSKKTEECRSSDIKECGQFPWLDIPTSYFFINDVRWGSLKEKSAGKTIDEYDQVAINNKAVYQSYPTTDIKIKDYSNEVVLLQIKTIEEVRRINQEISPVGRGSTIIEENYKEYGQLATDYLPDRYIQWTGKFDVDDDGIKEIIVMSNFTNSADAGSYSADVVKGKKIIFSVMEDNSSIVSADTPNGFFVEWRNPDDKSARCCEAGFMRTRFVLQDGKFIPIYEQEVRYIIVGKNDI